MKNLLLWVFILLSLRNTEVNYIFLRLPLFLVCFFSLCRSFSGSWSRLKRNNDSWKKGGWLWRRPYEGKQVLFSFTIALFSFLKSF